MTYSEIIAEATRLAKTGYGWQDIVVRSSGALSEDTARQIVWSAQRRGQQ